mgnify:CR=1 FL=1
MVYFNPGFERIFDEFIEDQKANDVKYIITQGIDLSSSKKALELSKKYNIILAAFGIYSGPINGNFGSQTEAAVKKYQTARGISAAGYVGPSTRTALNQ